MSSEAHDKMAGITKTVGELTFKLALTLAPFAGAVVGFIEQSVYRQAIMCHPTLRMDDEVADLGQALGPEEEDLAVERDAPAAVGSSRAQAALEQAIAEVKAEEAEEAARRDEEVAVGLATTRAAIHQAISTVMAEEAAEAARLDEEATAAGVATARAALEQAITTAKSEDAAIAARHKEQAAAIAEIGAATARSALEQAIATMTDENASKAAHSKEQGVVAAEAAAEDEGGNVTAPHVHVGMHLRVEREQPVEEIADRDVPTGNGGDASAGATDRAGTFTSEHSAASTPASACDNYRVDLCGSFDVCKCGWPKAAHSARLCSNDAFSSNPGLSQAQQARASLRELHPNDFQLLPEETLRKTRERLLARAAQDRQKGKLSSAEKAKTIDLQHEKSRLWNFAESSRNRMATQAQKKELPPVAVLGENLTFHASVEQAEVLQQDTSDESEQPATLSGDVYHQRKLVQLHVTARRIASSASLGSTTNDGIQGIAIGVKSGSERWCISYRLEEPKKLLSAQSYGHKELMLYTSQGNLVGCNVVLVLPPDRIRIPRLLNYECYSALTNERIDFKVTVEDVAGGQTITVDGNALALQDLFSKLTNNGTLRITLQSPEFQSMQLLRLRFDDHTREEQVEKLYLNPQGTMRATQLRCVLRWNARPKDLDLHCVSSEGSFVYHGKKQDKELLLDIDMRGGYGPETITVTPKAGVSYAFWVCNYSKIFPVDDDDDVDIALSAATITIYSGERLPVEICIPTSPVKGCYWWYVCTVAADENGCPAEVDPTGSELKSDVQSNLPCQVLKG